ncbi:MAG: hypothetical protein Harvfovirus14_32 [Harvfovirus sp.]|uniref:Uncharacterized protein n=1 Tax=Harvfovirus sp. TaxID=2487768 RepID=A0A3G5A4A9_9VIRU|nr:MAG: hypothetical protein Harvfovirus14_32 [Harvfovirus sp.]
MSELLIPVCQLSVCCWCSKLFTNEKIKLCCSMTYCDDCYLKHKESIVCRAALCVEPAKVETKDEKTVTSAVCSHCHSPLSFAEGVQYCMKCDIDNLYQTKLGVPVLKMCSICCKLQYHRLFERTRRDYLNCCGLFFCKYCLPRHEQKHLPYLDCCATRDSNKLIRLQCRECKSIVHLKCGSPVKTAEDHESKTYDYDIRNRDFLNRKFVCNKCIFLGGIKVRCECLINLHEDCNREIDLFKASKCGSCNASYCAEHFSKCHDCNNLLCWSCAREHKCDRCHQCQFRIDHIPCDFCNTMMHCKKLYFFHEGGLYSGLIQKNICCKCEEDIDKHHERKIVPGRCDDCKMDFMVPPEFKCDSCSKLLHFVNKFVLDHACGICQDDFMKNPLGTDGSSLTVISDLCCDCKNRISKESKILMGVLPIFTDGVITIISEFVCKPINISQFARCTVCHKYTCHGHLKKQICINCKDIEIDYDTSCLSFAV